MKLCCFHYGSFSSCFSFSVAAVHNEQHVISLPNTLLPFHALLKLNKKRKIIKLNNSHRDSLPHTVTAILIALLEHAIKTGQHL